MRAHWITHSIEHPSITNARRLLKARKGPPSEDDAPKRRSRPPRVMPGQMSIYDVLGSPDRPRP
jgi:hypothetical protein